MPRSEPASLPVGGQEFRRLVLSWTGSMTGDGIRVVALPLLTVSVDPSPGAVGLVAAITALPWLLLAVPAGVLVDRRNARTLLVVAHLLRALLTLAVVGLIAGGLARGGGPFSPGVGIATLCVVGFAITAVETMGDAASQTLLLRVVPRNGLERANARFVTVETLALDLAGPLSAGVLFVLAPWLPFAFSAAAFLVATAAVLRLPATRGDPDTTSTDHPLADIRAGLSRLVRDDVLRTLVLTVAVLAMANAAADAVLVLYSTQVLAMPEQFYPTLLAAYSVGTLLAAALVGRFLRRLRGGQIMVLAIAGLALAMVLLGLWPAVGVALAAYALLGLAGGTWNVLSATRRQRQTPHAMIGRVSSAFRVVAWGVLPIGAGLGGTLGEHLGVPMVFLIAGVVTAVAGLAVARSFWSTEPRGMDDEAPAPDPTGGTGDGAGR
ncbi:MFS transporter [Nakamurella flava]|uniref:MFS transporter n=1 Tax=Nakamurella flava TaxID=2576308 RepID=UPI0023EF4E43|nr:MFS transporter [Nakamurella flava]